MTMFLDKLKENVQNYSQRAAIVDQDGSRETSFEELDLLSDQIGGFLQENNVQKGDFVPILLPRSMEYVATLIGILKAGCAVIPLNMGYPKERMEFIREQCQSKIVVNQDFILKARLRKNSLKLVELREEDRSLVIYTSGSTGIPKGIIHNYKSISHAAWRFAKAMELTKEDKYLSGFPLYFIANIGDILSPLYAGAELHIDSEDIRRDVRRMEDYILCNSITGTLMSAQMVKLFKNKSQSLRFACCGSERVSGVCGDGFTLYNIYGSSEASPAVSYFKIDKKYENTPIGSPYEGMQIYIVREDGTQAAVGEEGEICISGPISDGYINLPEKTAEVFTKNPFSEKEEFSRLYHSGDIGILQEDGNIVYVNRKDWMVKINGQRVETGEIEFLINALPYVRTAVVKGFENQFGQTYLCAYFQLEKSGNKKASEAIKSDLKDRIPDYMIPQFFVEISEFPLNQNGKLDRLLLLPPEASSFQREYEAPKTKEEEILCHAFEMVLKINKIGRKDNFFALGGDSIAALRLQSQCKELSLTSPQIFEGKTPEKIAQLCTMEMSSHEDLYADCKIQKDFYPLTDSQMGVFLECMQSPESLMYNIPICLDIPVQADEVRLKKALEQVIDHYPILKIKVGEQDGVYGMIPCPDRSISVYKKETTDEELVCVKENFVRAFDLQNGSLFRVEIYRTPSRLCLLADFHHMICDGASIAEFFRQVSLAYEDKDLEAEELTQMDLSNYEETLKEKEVYKKAQKYFEEQLAGNEVDSNLMFDKQPEAGENKPSRRHYRNLHEMLTVEKLEQFTGEGGITENTFFMGAFAYALAKYTGQQESVFATVNNGRHDPRLHGTHGMLVRTLPMYVNIDEESTIEEYLNAMQKAFFETMKHDCCSFGELAGKYGITSDLMFVYQAETLSSVKLGEFEMPMEAMETGCALANLALHVFRKNGSYDMFFEYRSDIYEEETIKSFSNLYLRILEGFLECGQLRDITLISERESLLLDSFCGEEIPYNKGETVVDLFRRQAAETPHQTAVVYQEKQFTYGELDKITDKLAAYVHSKGLRAEDVVSVLIPRCEYMAIASLGVLKSGAAYQPLDPTYPMDRLAFMMEDAEAKLLIADESLLALVPGYKGEILLTKEIVSLPEAGILECATPKPKDLFILLYTSGTTGMPKGCMITHKNIRAFCNWYQRFYQVGTSSKVTAYASYGFDANMMETYPALTCGATLYIVPEELRLELTVLNEYFEKEKITHSFMTTQVGRQFAAEIENHSLKFLSTGGEALAPVQAESDFTFCNLYGPTESTVLVTAYKVDKNRDYTNIPIGSAIDNIELYVLDKYHRRLPVGALGELCVAGEQVSRGYLNRKEQTEKVYTANPVKEKAGYERIYHTGDIVRFLKDGNIQFVGRRDGQVKIRGFRIELPEVAGVIQKFPGIRDVAVTAFDAASGGKAMAAYVVSDETVDAKAIGDFIRAEKPPYMVPAVIMQIEKIPLNQNGKLDRRALPDPKQQVSSAEKDRTRPLSLLETELSETVGNILGHRDFSVDTNLMHVGLTSLSAIKLAASIHKEYGISLEVKQMMKECSILFIENEIYTVLRHGREKIDTQSHKTQAEKGIRSFYPLTQTQMGVFYDVVKDPENTNYNIPSLIRFPKTLTAAKLSDAVKKTIEAHPYLNTTFEYKKGNLVHLPGVAQAKIQICRMTEEELTQYVTDFVKPFELIGNLLYRLSVVDTEKSVCLLMDFHHIIFDGGSMDLFLRQIIAACDGVVPEKEDYTYFDFVIEEEEAEGKEQYQKAAAHFRQLLINCEGASEMPAELQKAKETGIKRECVVLCNEKAVETFCRTNQVTPAHLFLGAVFYTLARYLSSQEVYISTISSGRSNPKLQNSVGMFVKTLPLVGNIAGDKTVLDFIKEAKEGMLSSMEYESYPFTKLAADYNFSPQIMYACQLGVIEEMSYQGQPLVIENIDENRSKFKISIHIEKRENCPAVCVQYNDALYQAETMEQFTRSIAVCVQRMIANPKGKLRKISLVTEEQQVILDKFRQSECFEMKKAAESEGISFGLFHGMFEQQADQQPEKVALVACDGTWTYRQLEQNMNRIANALISRSFGKGQTAVILLPRKGSLIQAMYGVMKAGGAYIPCDPDYPKERILQITKDSGASLIITSKHVLPDREALQNTVDVEELLAFFDCSRPEAEVHPEDMAYMIYTSGSTGKPKGVILEHKGIANYLKNHEINSHIHACVTDGSIMVSVTTISFDMSLKEIAVALCNGLTLVLADEDTVNHPVRLAKLMEETKGDIFNATPSRMLQYMDSQEFCQSLAKCKVVMSGGEAYSLKLLERLQSVTEARIFNTYGPTEITVSSNAKELTDKSKISIGRPLLGYTEYIADSDGNLLPPCVTGELYIGGPGVARGYHNLQEMTAERFISFHGERVYKSGDYAKWTESGDIVILGRTDNQVKLRGLRIELPEIETCIGEYPSIKNVVVIIRKLEDTEHLCAYYTAEKPIAVDQLKAFLGERLTKYMVPTGFCQLPELPMTANGKIDRKKLPDPKLAKAGEYVAPASEAECKFCKIFEEVLHLERVGSCDDFFDLGGTSLMVTRVIIMATEFGFDITYGDVFSHSTPKALAEMFCQEKGYTSELEDLSKYDYSQVEEILTQNNLETFKAGEAQLLGNVLITGVTGFLGIHILREFLETEKGAAYCILRKGQYNSLQDRLKSLLFYYFENTFEEEMGNRILLKEGDITNWETFEGLTEENIQTVINCAANVKHFSSGTDIEDVNVGGVENAIKFCQKTGSRIIQISTTSVAGFRMGLMPPAETIMKENMLYFGQILDTKYGHSKFMAERLVLAAVADGLDGKIMRVGNLSARDTDGEFQMNYATNSFVGRLKAFETIGKFPYSMMDRTAEMAPIDSTAQAILLLAKTPKGCCIFHPYNNHSIYMGDIIYAMKSYGVNIELADDAEYLNDLEEAQKDPEKAVILSSMIAYENMGHGQKIESIAKANEYTMQVLYRLGFHWPTTSKEYVGKFVNALGGLGYFM